MGQEKSQARMLYEKLREKRFQQYPIYDHPISSRSEYERGLYYDMLCMLAQYQNNDPTAEIGFIQRIMAGCGDNAPITEHIARSMKFTSEKIGDVIDMIKQNKIEDIFILDAFILVSLQGSPDKERLPLTVNLSETLVSDKNRIRFIVKLAKAITEQNFEPIRDQMGVYEDMCEYLSCYVYDKSLLSTNEKKYIWAPKNQKTVLTQIEELNNDLDGKTTLKKLLCIENQYINKELTIGGYDMVAIKNCDISACLNLKNINLLLVSDCNFHDIDGVALSGFCENARFNIRNTSFSIISTKGVSGAIINASENSSILFETCSFKNIYSTYRRDFIYRGTGGFIIAENGSIMVKGCEFEDCLSRGGYPGYLFRELKEDDDNSMVNCERMFC